MAGLECTFVGCTSGEAGAKFKTPAAAADMASDIAYLNQHRWDVHGRPAGAAGGASKIQHDTEVRENLSSLTNNSEPDEKAAKYEEVSP
jgi:hypothetical protein